MAGPPITSDSEDLAPLAEINVTPLVDVMLVLLIIFMISAGVQTVQMQYTERQKVVEAAEDKLDEAEQLLAELKKKEQEHTKVDIDLPKVDSDVVKLSDVKKLKLVVDDHLRFSIDNTVILECLKVSPAMEKFIGNVRDASKGDEEQVALEPCLKALGEKLVDNKKLQDDKELYLLASRSIHYGQVLKFMAAIRQAGVTKFGLVAEPGTLGGATVEKTPPANP